MFANLFAPLAMKVSAAIIAVLIVLLPLAYLKGREIERGAWERKEAREAAAALDQARKADEVALGTVATDKAAVDASEARARGAAANSDDPLAAALESIRSGQ